MTNNKVMINTRKELLQVFSIKLKHTREEIQQMDPAKLDLKDPSQFAYYQIYIQKKNYGNRSWGRNGTKEEQYNGLVVQYTILKMLGVDFSSNTNSNSESKFDNGIDFTMLNANLDVKSRSSKFNMQYMYVHNIMQSQLSYATDYYILCNYNTKTNVVQVCGVVRKSDFTTYYKQFLHIAGERLHNNSGKEITVQQNMYCLPQYCVFDVSNLLDLVNFVGVKSKSAAWCDRFLSFRMSMWEKMERNSYLREEFETASKNYTSDDNILYYF